MKKIETILTLGLALIIIFISSNFLQFVWQNALGYYLLIVLAGFFCGILNVEFDLSLKMVAITFITSSILFIVLYISFPLLYGEARQGEINDMVAIVTTQMARTVIISFPITIFTCLFGSFSGKALTKS